MALHVKTQAFKDSRSFDCHLNRETLMIPQAIKFSYFWIHHFLLCCQEKFHGNAKLKCKVACVYEIALHMP